MVTTLETIEIQPKLKIPTISIPSDDCVVHTGQIIEDGEDGKPVIVYEGNPYYLHKGEHVECSPVTSVGEYIAISRLTGVDGTEGMGERLWDVCVALAQTILGWNWTDNASQPLEQPFQNPKVFTNLSNEELLWLLMASKRPAQETGDERKNA